MEEIERRSLAEQYRDIIGYLPQDFGYYKNQTPRQFLSYIAALKGLTIRMLSVKRQNFYSLYRLVM